MKVAVYNGMSMSGYIINEIEQTTAGTSNDSLV